MAVTAITILSLTATAGVGQITVAFTLASPGCLPYLDYRETEIWASATNDRTAATKVGTTTGIQFVHSGLGASVTRYYWARAVNKAGTQGDWYPLSSTAGVSATTSTTAPGPDSVGEDELQDDAVSTTKIQNLAATSAKIGNLAVTTGKIDNLAVTTGKIDNLAVTNAKINDLSASKITAGTITASISITSPTITGGLIQTSSGSTRVEINGSGNYIAVYTSGSQKVLMGTASVAPTLAITGHSIEALNANGLGGTTGHGARLRASGGGSGLGGIGSGGGGYAFYSESGGYGPFTGSHDGLLESVSPARPGELMYDVRVVSRSGVDDVLTEIALSYERGQRGVVGVLSRRSPLDPTSDLAALAPSPNDRNQPTFVKKHWAKTYDRAVINSVGEGQLLVCGRGGDLENGDLVWASDMVGKAERQPDDIVRAATVAKVRERVVFSDPDEARLVACIYLCG